VSNSLLAYPCDGHPLAKKLLKKESTRQRTAVSLGKRITMTETACLNGEVVVQHPFCRIPYDEAPRYRRGSIQDDLRPSTRRVHKSGQTCGRLHAASKIRVDALEPPRARNHIRIQKGKDFTRRGFSADVLQTVIVCLVLTDSFHRIKWPVFRLKEKPPALSLIGTARKDHFHRR
jgi:hypothetical protein